MKKNKTTVSRSNHSIGTERAEAVAGQLGRQDQRQILEFSLGKQRYGVDILAVSEVVTYVRPTPVIHLPQYVAGIINLRGNILALLDMAAFFDLNRDEITPRTRILVIQSAASGALKDAGFIVDQVAGARRIDVSRLYPPPLTVKGNQRECILGVIEEKEGPMILLGQDQIFTSQRIASL